MSTLVPLKQAAAALFVALLSLVCIMSGASAQTIDNTAFASWQFDGEADAGQSNTVSVTVQPLPPQITTFTSVIGTGNEVTFTDPRCGASQSTGSGGEASEAPAVTASITPSSTYRAGEFVIFEIIAAAANTDSSQVDSLRVEIQTSTGDREELIVYETGENTGVFMGRIATRRMPPQPVAGDCELSVARGTVIGISALTPDGTDVIVHADVDVLADPFGVVFDSETGTPVSGARITLVDAVTGQPATVFAEDGVTPWPSTVISGQPITDGAGNVYPMEPGEYWFPLTFLGQYRLVIEPPDPYTAPSVVTPDELARLTRPDGGAFIIEDASYGGTLVLDSPVPIQIDIPLDRPSLDISLSKNVSRQQAQPGDAVFYTIVARNSDLERVKRNVVLVDTPSPWLRIRTDSIRIDGQPAPAAATVSDDGRTLAFSLGDIQGGDQRRVTYAMVVRADAPPGQAINRAQTTDSLGRTATASASLDIERDTIAGRMTIIGRITAGDCSIHENRIGIPGVRVMMEDGSFAVTDADGRYHFEGVVPGTHVVQAARMTLPEGGEFVDCSRSSRNAGSTNSRFVIGQGGSLIEADFHAVIPEDVLAALTAAREERRLNAGSQVDSAALPVDVTSDGIALDRPSLAGATLPVQRSALSFAKPEEAASAVEQDWLALGDGPDGWLTPAEDANPRAPAVKVAFRHRKGQSINLYVDGKPVDPYAFDGTKAAQNGPFAVSLWRGIPLDDERTVLKAEIVNSMGGINDTLERVVYFTSQPAKVELVEEQSVLVADGVTRPVAVVRLTDRNGRPVREGVSGEFTVNEPFESASQIELQQLRQLTGIGSSSARWVIEGDQGLARIELAPTMVSGSLRLEFNFDNGTTIQRREAIDAWVVPGDIEWTIVGLAEGSIGARTVADNMERTGNFDSDLGEKARVALYAKGRVLGKYLMTLAYDSAKQREDQRVLGTLDPDAYYTVFADGSSRRFDAPSREKLYVRIETSTFFALYGDFETGFDDTRLARYQRTATGMKAEARFGEVRAKAFAAKIGTRFRRDEIQGNGLSGPYRLSSRAIVANSETVTLEVRDRFRSELIVSSRTLTRFIDYDVDVLSGTITFSQPITSRDFDLNPQFIVIEYETGQARGGEWNGGLRADWTSKSGDVRIGATAISDQGDASRTNIGAVDARVRVGEATEIRAELAFSKRDGDTSNGWLVEAHHQTGKLDVLAYARSVDQQYGVGQQNNAELGRRKFGLDARYELSERFSVLTSLWQDDSLADIGRRRAAQVQLGYRSNDTDLRLGISHFNDRLADGTRNTSTLLEAGATQRLLDNKLELSAATSIALDGPDSVDLPARHRFEARYAVSQAVKLIGSYEIANGDTIDARTVRGGVEVTPWQGGRVITTLGQQGIGEYGNRSFAAYGLAQTFQVTPTLTIDATVDGNKTLGSSPALADIVNPAQPVANGGPIGQDNLLFEDFTAVTLGAAWRKARWSATARGEYRDGEFADRKGFTFGAIRQLGEGSVVGSGFTWTKADGVNGASTEIMDATLAFAHRPDESEVAFLGKLEYRSDQVTGAVAGETGPVGRTTLLVDGDATSRRLIASLSTNWSPEGEDDDGLMTRRDEFGLFLGARYNFDRFEGFDLGSFTALAGVDARIGIGERLEIGGSATVRANVDDGTTSFSVGPQVGFVPADGVLVTVGYNITGFRDEDFSASRNTDKGVFVAVRAKFDADTFSFLGLGR
ncbi:hypothetical protein [Parerythrobacter aestuarii]|uniref:hypothetical protein n=1 Tax=Parerythrobacter aestuarii TaxID=3020909 RepID=UPI0024DED051|nr:hypothetical protein [Parerythrobacter aestuarii]